MGLKPAQSAIKQQRKFARCPMPERFTLTGAENPEPDR